MTFAGDNTAGGDAAVACAEAGCDTTAAQPADVSGFTTDGGYMSGSFQLTFAGKTTGLLNADFIQENGPENYGCHSSRRRTMALHITSEK